MIKEIENDIIKISAENGNYLTLANPQDGFILAKTIYLGKNDTVENYKEITNKDFPIIINNKMSDLEKINKEQDNLINCCLLSIADMYNVIEPSLEIETLDNNTYKSIIKVFSAIVKRKLRNIEDIPERHRKEVEETLAI